MPLTRTFSYQSTLPRLPIPTLTETTSRYLKSIVPLVSPTELKITTDYVNDFTKPGGYGEVLQHRLIEHDKEQPHNWLSDWWLKLAYHSWRDASMINSNWYLLVKNHPATPKILLEDSSTHLRQGKFTEFQIKRAAGMISLMLDYKNSIDNGTLPPEKTRAGPVCMHQYTLIFGVTRRPLAGCDENVQSFPATAKHINVLVRDQIYSVDVFDSNTGSRLPISAIESQLQAVVEDVEKSDAQPPICLLTSEHRDSWAKTYRHLKGLDSVNRESFANIESSLFNVSLDDWVVDKSLTGMARNVFHGERGHNRWFEKCISVVFDNSGRCGVNGEHSPLDALVPATMMEECASREPASDPANVSSSFTLNKPFKLKWVTDESVIEDLKKAQSNADRLIADSDVSVLHFTDYGADFIKKFGKVSPDAYVQMCLQLTYYKIHSKFAPVYESASTRQFLHGRTETCRSLSVEQAEFVLGFLNKQKSSLEKYQLLVKAAKAHVEYITSASQGKGCDRHLLGLRCVIKDGEKPHPLFTDRVFKESTHFRLSTSGLFPAKYVLATGFGAVVPDGYGMNYIFQPDHIKMGIESKKSCKETSTLKYKDTLVETFKELGELCKEINPAAKL
ncbi:hypothetical protein HK099_005296 [Clydaea vesicula]|uniref:Choline/carnitine acyltransferase domain-containing protein n=1 Tax=Clydaea vesicula TaxID=447962 RepID=A0AAD5TZK5_9FUNG|nr:hypothetical protein HK099_005296 [Clydaea vesicula]KAJ3390418.1 hypothetical protein HDU92_000492 [Lobulomyces angularis]